MNNSPLIARHQQMNAKLADFGGWLMPIEYPATGVIAEYTAVRQAVGIFDVSHLGKISVKGEGSLKFLNEMFTNDLSRITSNQAQYTLLCNDNGGVVDDLIIYRMSDLEFFLVPNASNSSAVYEILQSAAPNTVEIENLHHKHGVIALQGPKSIAVLHELGIKTEIKYMEFILTEIKNCPVILCRTGYTGEHGYEIIPAWSDTEKVWDILAGICEGLEGAICGLGARDVLRTEMGYALHGHELSLEISPVQASAGWAIGWEKDSFRGKKSLVEQKEKGLVLKLKAILAIDRGIARQGMDVKNLAGEVIGQVTSGTFSPALKKGIGLVLINPKVGIGDQVKIDIRGVDSEFKIVDLPFVTSRVR